MADIKYEDKHKPSKLLRIIVLTTRLTTLVTLSVSMGLLRFNSISYNVGVDRDTFNYNDVRTYRYVYFVILGGFCYTLSQVPFALFYFFKKMPFIDTRGFLKLESYCDMVFMTLLATALGSLLGATIETKKNAHEINYFYVQDDARDYHSKIGDFCMLAYISAVLLLIGFSCFIISSIISSRAHSSK